MRTRSPSNSARWFAGLVAVATVAVAVAGFAFGKAKDGPVASAHHASRWDKFASDVSYAAADAKTEPLALARVAGGVAPHDIPTTIPRLVEFYARLKRTQNVRNIVVIGPDHTDAGASPITVSNAPFVTAFGKLEPIEGLPAALERAGAARIDETPFDPEHSVGAHMLVISRIFPETHVTPIILRADVSREQADLLGRTLASSTDDSTVIVASVDFMHYLTTERSLPFDQVSGGVLRNLDIGSLSMVNADSVRTLQAIMRAMLEKGATGTDAFEVMNTNDLAGLRDYTTGYVFGYWGKR